MDMFRRVLYDNACMCVMNVDRIVCGVVDMPHLYQAHIEVLVRPTNASYLIIQYLIVRYVHSNALI